MNRLLASTAIFFAASGSPLLAQAVSPFAQTFAAGDVYGSNLIGQRLYISEAEFGDTGMISAEMRADWDDVGEIADLLISQDGEIKAVLLDIGGFLGLGERTVAVDMSALHFLGDETDIGDVFVAINGTEESLENAPAFERPDLRGGITQIEGAADPAAMIPVATEAETTAEINNIGMTGTETETVAVQVVEPEAETVEVAAVMAPVDTSLRLTRPAMEMEGYAQVETGSLTAEMLTGAPVYGLGEEEIGEIDALLAGPDGALAGAVIDIGGFLGIGEREVAIGFDEMQIVRDDDGDDVRVYIEASQEKLEARTEYVD